MIRIEVKTQSKSYPIFITSNLSANLEENLKSIKSISKIFIISHQDIFENNIYKQSFAFLSDKIEVIVENGEQSKSFTALEAICEQILKHRPDRNSIIIALGGGVIGDLSGLAASIILRGIRFIQIPTTLLAMVDSSIGGKTAINSQYGKNLIGSFYQPEMVLIDIDFLLSLSKQHYVSAFAEIIKAALIYDKDFFEYLRQNVEKFKAKNKEFLEHVISKSCHIKSKIVSQDEKENDLRAILNFGHSFGHAFEVATTNKNTLSHGEAVALGMVCDIIMSSINDQDKKMLINLIQDYGLPYNVKNYSFNIDEILNLMSADKKNKDNKIAIVSLKSIGEAIVVYKDKEEIKNFLNKEI